MTNEVRGLHHGYLADKRVWRELHQGWPMVLRMDKSGDVTRAGCREAKLAHDNRPHRCLPMMRCLHE